MSCTYYTVWAKKILCTAPTLLLPCHHGTVQSTVAVLFKYPIGTADGMLLPCHHGTVQSTVAVLFKYPIGTADGMLELLLLVRSSSSCRYHS